MTTGGNVFRKASRYRSLSLSLSAVLVLCTACAPDAEPITPLAQAKAERGSGDRRIEDGGPETADDMRAQVSRTTIPGFAGGWYDSTGVLHVALTPAANGVDAVAALRGDSRFGVEAKVSVHTERATRDFATLHHWRKLLRSRVFGVGVSSIGIDASTNRVLVGLAPGGTRKAIRSLVRELDIPLDAVYVRGDASDLAGRPVAILGDESGDASRSAQPLIEECDMYCTPPEWEETSFMPRRDIHLPANHDPAIGLASRQAQLVGGVGFSYQSPSLTGSSVWGCTIGLPATFSGLNGIVTAAHCAARPWDTFDGSRYHQDADAAPLGVGNLLGTSRLLLRQPVQSCVLGVDWCLYDDVQLVRFAEGQRSVRLGCIARPQQEFAPIDQRGAVLAVQDYCGHRVQGSWMPPLVLPFAGQPVLKVGTRTGQTRGVIANPCVDSRVREEKFGKMLYFACQLDIRSANIVQEFSGSGDSGATIYLNDVGTTYPGFGIGVLSHQATLVRGGSNVSRTARASFLWLTNGWNVRP